MHIQSNGSKWAGESPDPVGKLLDLLEREPLDPRFGKFISRDPSGATVRVFGNFAHLSHVFQISGTREEMAPLVASIQRAMRRKAYRELRRSWVR
jgi:hypothetical protein